MVTDYSDNTSVYFSEMLRMFTKVMRECRQFISVSSSGISEMYINTSVMITLN